MNGEYFFVYGTTTLELKSKIIVINSYIDRR